MPYGLPKEVGGDNKANETWMKRCISRVMKGDKSKESAIRICKKTLMKSKGNAAVASLLMYEYFKRKEKQNES